MRTAIFSTYPPRACGIGTFAFDVRTALLGVPDVEDCSALVVVDDPSSPQRPEILQTISQGARGDYVRAARTLGRLDIDVVLLQHEYGIFGGLDGTYALSFARELAQPLVVTLHTVLSNPTEHQLQVLTALCHEAERVIVMTETARRLIIELGVCDDEKLRVIPHGAPVALGAARAELAAGRRPRYVTSTPGGYARIDSRFLLSSFGLLSPGKGLETMIDALPAIVDRHPEVLYLIAGRTHPQIARRQGEEYRFMLERRIVDLGLDDHVQFDDRFLSIEELADLLAATDVFVTPYTNSEQSSSGALTFALAAGCAVVSTPFLYAEDMLRSGAGMIVPFADPAALADAVCALIEHPEQLAAARAEARRVGSGLAWPSVAEATAAVLEEAAVAAPRRTPMPDVGLELADARTNHLLTLVDDCGIIQHARGAIPNRYTGYCVDDIARLVVVALELESRTGDSVWTPVLGRSLAFLYDASDENGAGMRNFMSYDRNWLDEPHVGDHVGRSIWALGDVLSTAWVPAVVEPCQRLLAALVRSLGGELSIRTAAYATLGLARLDADRLEDDARRLLERCVTQLEAAYEASSDDGWRWFEDALTYDNARLPHALIVGGTALGREDAVAAGLESLAWLGDECGLGEGLLRLPGNEGAPSRRARAGRRRRAAARRIGVRRGGDRRVRRHGRSRTRRPRPARLRVVPRTQPARPAALRLRDRRLLRRSRRRGRERERRRRVDARIPSRSARARRCRPAARPSPRCRGEDGRVTAVRRELFTRHPGNPLLTAEDWPVPVNAVFNPAAATVGDETVLLARVETLTGISHLTVARSANGVDGWRVAAEPLLAPQEGIESEQWGFEDARAVWVEELDRFVITCTAFGPQGPVVYLATTEDFTTVERRGIVSNPEDKNAALLPERIHGRWILFHRPTSGFRVTHPGIALSRSHDLRSWSPPEVVLQPRDGAWWDSLRIGIGPPLLKTEHGWLLIYHGVKEMVGGAIYRVGLALLDLEKPARVLHRADDWIFAPNAPYERQGDVPNAIFPCGLIHDTASGELRLYYGAADTSICLATAQLDELLEVVLAS